MFFTALAFGAMSAIGIFITLLRCPRMFVLKLLGKAYILDILCTMLMFAMHWGTAIGGFSAVIAGLFCSLGITVTKACLGYIDKDVYYLGKFGDTRPLHERSKHKCATESPV